MLIAPLGPDTARLPLPPRVAEVLGRYWRATDATTGEEERLNRVMFAIPRCRTGRLGSAAFHCAKCDYSTLRMRSCGNRHCPTCNGRKRSEWRDRLVSWSLDCDYLHVVFTLPHELNEVIRAHQKILYSLKFRCVGDVLTQTARRDYGCQVGMVEVLHTWGQRLGLHVHTHVVMTAGGLSLDETQWLPISADDAAMQREVLAAKFRKTYLRRLKTLIMQGKVVWPEADQIIERLAGKDWVVNVQAPPPKCVGSEAVINYLASYVIGGPISDARIIADDGQRVTFRIKDYKAKTIEYEQLPGVEFAVRYGNHSLPWRMPRVRCKALFRAEGRVERLSNCQSLIAASGLDRKGGESVGGERLLGHEHDEDEIEIVESAGVDCHQGGGCRQCGSEMKSERSDWISAATTRLMLQTVAAILLSLQRDGRSLLIQIQQSLLRHPLIRENLFTPYQIQLIESMLLECLEDPQPLLRSILGRNHPLIRDAYEQAARPPPEPKQEPANV